MHDSVDRDAFRQLMGSFATGVTVITAFDPDGAPAGMTASAVSAVSLDPPVVLVCVDHSADFHGPLAAAPVFAVNILAGSQQAVSNRFATKVANKFAGVAHTTHEAGAPLLDGALASIVCAPWQSFEAGDHTVFLGRVIGGSASDEPPLVHFRGEYRSLA